MNYTYSNGSGVRGGRNRTRAYGSAYAAAQTKTHDGLKPERSEHEEKPSSGTVVTEAQEVREAAKTQAVTAAAEVQTVAEAAQARAGTGVTETQTVAEAKEAQTVREAAETQTVAEAAQARAVTVSLPGNAARVPLALGTPHIGVKYNPDTAEAVITEAGGYLLKFSLAIDSPIDTKCAVTVRANGRKLPGGVFNISLNKGSQSWSESLEAALDAGDAVGLAFYSASPLAVTISGDGSLPEMAIEKISG